jgi:hypothetical protein
MGIYLTQVPTIWSVPGSGGLPARFSNPGVRNAATVLAGQKGAIMEMPAFWKQPRTGEARQENRADPPQVCPSPLGWKFGSKLIAFSAHWAGFADSVDS